MKSELICIMCPIGCRLTVIKDNDSFKILNNQCKRGEKYAIKESTAPTRVITSTVKIKNAVHVRLPVKTSEAISKELIFEVMKIINSIEVASPIKLGEAVAKNVLESGVDIVATRTM